MILTIDVKNESILNHLLGLLKHFDRKDIEIITDIEGDREPKYTDEYVQENWKKILSEAFADFDHNYYKSMEYKIERGKYLMEKYK